MVPYDISRQRIFWAGNRADFGRVNTGQNSLALEGPLHQVRHTSLTFGLYCFQICNELCQKLNHFRENWVFCFLSLTLLSLPPQVGVLKSKKYYFCWVSFAVAEIPFVTTYFEIMQRCLVWVIQFSQQIREIDSWPKKVKKLWLKVINFFFQVLKSNGNHATLHFLVTESILPSLKVTCRYEDFGPVLKEDYHIRLFRTQKMKRGNSDLTWVLLQLSKTFSVCVLVPFICLLCY